MVCVKFDVQDPSSELEGVAAEAVVDAVADRKTADSVGPGCRQERLWLSTRI